MTFIEKLIRYPANFIQACKRIYHETVREVKKCTWPSRPELMESTLLVITAIILLTAFISIVDMACRNVVSFLIM